MNSQILIGVRLIRKGFFPVFVCNSQRAWKGIGLTIILSLLVGRRAPRISQLNSINETLEQRLENTKMLITFNSPHRPCGKRGPARATARKPQWNIKMCFISPFYSITFFSVFFRIIRFHPFCPVDSLSVFLLRVIYFCISPKPTVF